MTLDELTYDLAGTYDHEPPDDRPLLDRIAHSATSSCPLCGGGIQRRATGLVAVHEEASCPVVFVRDGDVVPDSRYTPRPLARDRARRLTSEVS